MAGKFHDLSWWARYDAFLGAAMKALQANSYYMASSGDRRRELWTLTKKGGAQLSATVRTSNTGVIEFRRTADGWRTLDQVEMVVIASVDKPADPTAIDVYLLEQAVVISAFNELLNARAELGLPILEGSMAAVPLVPNLTSEVFGKCPLLADPQYLQGSVSLDP